ncbi:hypothetical protein CYMTET_51914 [Cymbomonas tetramitiformis]|uniref:Uncharacterized protein n=1 Tax=Cymbomonas tetramitiformis TaxID=36881 RepID=A0AAE0ERV7_9CHLO|nr:hypothetical protein CYMTET_51914 [Cymbomonas tetramitiformis]
MLASNFWRAAQRSRVCDIQSQLPAFTTLSKLYGVFSDCPISVNPLYGAPSGCLSTYSSSYRGYCASVDVAGNDAEPKEVPGKQGYAGMHRLYRYTPDQTLPVKNRNHRKRLWKNMVFIQAQEKQLADQTKASNRRKQDKLRAKWKAGAERARAWKEHLASQE